MLNTTPLGSHRTLADYARFLITRFIVPQFTRGSREVYVIFDNPGRLQEIPKQFERRRRDHSATVVTAMHAMRFVLAKRSRESGERTRLPAEIVNETWCSS